VLNEGNGGIEYYFYDNSSAPRQDPEAGLGAIGIVERPSLDPNENCITAPPSCDFPCPPDEVAPWKEAFYESRLAWKAQQALLPGLTDSLAREETKAAILTHRQAMNRYGNQILTQFSQDTVQVQVDSILHWLQLMETYVTDLRLAKHYFFSGRLFHCATSWIRSGRPNTPISAPFIRTSGPTCRKAKWMPCPSLRWHSSRTWLNPAIRPSF
jgi:hypothetical protein